MCVKICNLVTHFTFLYKYNATKTPMYPMARAMFEYTKTVLKKVSFNVDLFCKELDKAFTRLLPYEIAELRIWLQDFTANKPELTVCFTHLKQ